MPLNHGYGVVAGTFASFTRDDPDDFGHWYHGKLRVSTPAGQYEAALDVDTPGGAGVSYRIVEGLADSDIAILSALPDGYTALAASATSGALDYVRSPILADRWVIRVKRRFIAHRRATWTGSGWAPTPIDRLLAWARPWTWPFLNWLHWRTFPWVVSNGDNALNQLEALLPQAVRLFVLGEPYTSGLGVHNVHLNQGDPPGPHQAEDGIWQDGAVVVRYADGSVRIWQVKFNTQSLDTGPDGLPR